MSEYIETILARMNDFSGLEDPFGASHFPVYNTATFNLKKQSGEKIYDYTRSGNPTREALENIFTIAEKGAGCVCTHTGIAAVALLFETVLKAGSHILIERDCYGGTFRLLKIYKEKYNVTLHFTDFNNFEEIKKILSSYPVELVLCESPTNPGLKIIDLKKIAQLTKEHNSIFAVDNSLATFISQNPIELGADFSLFSTTKYISGHGSVIAGAIVASTPELAKKMHFYANAQGRSQNPLDVFLISLGIPTLLVRYRAHQENTYNIIEYLKGCKFIKGINYPGLKENGNFELARQQMKYFPGVFTADFETTEKAESFISRTKLFGEKASFGSPDSRVEIPSKISHASFTADELSAIGIKPSTVRFSIGLENTKDLINDIEQAVK